MLHSPPLWLLAVSSVLASAQAAQQGRTAAAPEELERSGWFAEASLELQRAEYRFAPIEGGAPAWSAPNRAQAFRSRVSASGIEVVSNSVGTDESCASWKLVLATTSFGRVGHVRELTAPTVTVTNERAELDHGPLLEWLVNDERGLEQGWTIALRPSGVDPLWIGLDFRGDLRLTIDAGARSGVLVDTSGTARLRYRDLLVFDATGRELAARLAPHAAGVGIEIDDASAVYPLTVDPVLTGPAWTAESDQSQAFLGYSVASAGDVNGDGFSDVIVGALRYSNGETQEGRAFVYLGSSTGLSTSAAWTAESNQANAEFGFCVATAGDVNGDGFSDVIVGARHYANGQSNEGRAFVYLGSATGLATSAAWTAESDQVDARYGSLVATAGDVNGDGYSDVIVCAPQYTNGDKAEGRADLYLGSSAGLSTSPAWTAEGNQFAASFGFSAGTAGDVNGDGYDDVIVGALTYDDGQSDEGRAFVYLGSSTGLAASPAWTAESNLADSWFGWSVATAGDVNGDGYADVIVAAALYDNGQMNEGRAYMYLGASSGLSTSAAWTAEGNQANAWFGHSVTTAGDVNGDGYGDVIVGALYYDNGQMDEGRAYVYLGASSGLAVSAAWTAESDQAFTMYGSCVATVGDVDGDGYSDVIVGAYQYDNGQPNEGRAFVYRGSALGLATSAAWTAESNTAGAEMSFSVAHAGDVNGDGYSDVIVGAYAYSDSAASDGRAFVYLGSDTGLSTSAAWTAGGNQNGAAFGIAVSSAGDVNGDGYSDVIVGASSYDNGQTNEGRAFVYHGSALGLSASAAWTAESNQAEAQFAYSAASAGDVNGDGYSDVIVGSYAYDNGQANEGRAFVYLGSATGLSASAAWTAESDQAEAHFGISAATAGDVNADGHSDVIVGAQHYTNGQSEEGRAFVYLGSSTGLATSAAWTVESNQASAWFGFSVATAGDVNADGYSDVIVAAYAYDNAQIDEGRTFVYLGSSAGLSPSAAWTAESDQPGAGFGSSVATAGDVNGDGYSDVIVGAYAYSNGQSSEGRAFVFLGASSGLSATPAWTAESDQMLALFGTCVATIGDVNGDGYSDVIVGAPWYGNGELAEGRAFVYLGNDGRGGWTLAPQQRRANDAAPIDLLGRSANKHEFRIRLGFERELTGINWASGLTPKARLEWEVQPLRLPLDGSRIESGAEQTITGSPLVFNELVEFASADGVSLPIGVAYQVATGAYHWRARVRTNNPLFPVTPWVTMPWNNESETKLRVGPLPAIRAPH